MKSAGLRSLFALLLISATTSLAQVPLPDDINIVIPRADLRRDVAAFSGKWSGVWGGQLPSILIVEEIDAERAKVIYAWGDAPNWRIEKGFSRFSATVASGDMRQLQFAGDSVAFTVQLNSDLSSLLVTREVSMPRQFVSAATFKRITQ
jgi:hypothetical protein